MKRDAHSRQNRLAARVRRPVDRTSVVQIASLDFPADVGLLERPHYLPRERQIISLKSGARVVEAAYGGERHNELCEVVIARRDFGAKSALSDSQNARKLGLRLITVLNEKFVLEGLGGDELPGDVRIPY